MNSRYLSINHSVASLTAVVSQNCDMMCSLRRITVRSWASRVLTNLEVSVALVLPDQRGLLKDIISVANTHSVQQDNPLWVLDEGTRSGMLFYFRVIGLLPVALCDDTSSVLFVFGDSWNPREVDISYFLTQIWVIKIYRLFSVYFFGLLHFVLQWFRVLTSFVSIFLATAVMNVSRYSHMNYTFLWLIINS